MGETIGAMLIRRLAEEGVGHVFGVPGDYVLTLFKEMEKSALAVVNTSDEQGAGFAADAYARVRGLGAVCVTYCVGGLKIANAVGQAYAERSPVVVISGAPGTRERKNTLLHHTVRNFDTQARVFAELTAATAILDDPDSAADEVNRLLSVCRQTSRPVYIEIPRDMVLAEAAPARRRAAPPAGADPDVLAAAIAEAMRHIEGAKRPVIIAGEELHRFRLQRPLAELVAKSGIPVAATIMGKSVFPESDPAYIGVYEGAMGRDATRAAVEGSDCLILLGAMMTDMNLGIYTAKIDQRAAVYAASDKISVGLAAYDGIGLANFVTALAAQAWRQRGRAGYDHPEHPGPFAATGKPMTTAALFHQINAFLTDNDVVVADTGDCLFGAADLYIHDGAHFLGPAYYCSLGFAVPAALGVQTAAPELRPIVLVGDGAFQMTGMELSAMVRYGKNPIVIVLDNDGYGTERPMLDGAFNDLVRWNFARIPEVLGGGLGIKVTTETEMAAALAKARSNSGGFTLIQVALDRDDHSPALLRLTKTLAERIARKG